MIPVRSLWGHYHLLSPECWYLVVITCYNIWGYGFGTWKWGMIKLIYPPSMAIKCHGENDAPLVWDFAQHGDSTTNPQGEVQLINQIGYTKFWFMVHDAQTKNGTKKNMCPLYTVNSIAIFLLPAAFGGSIPMKMIVVPTLFNSHVLCWNLGILVG